MTNKEKMYRLGEKPSIIRQLYNYANQRKKEIGSDNVYDFSLGNPNIPIPKVVNDKLIELLSNNNLVLLHGYSIAPGHKVVRDSIANYLNKTYQTNEKGDLIYLTTGAASGLAIAFNALLEPNEEVIVFAPFWPEYRVLVEHASGILKILETDNKTFIPNLNKLEETINEKTKFLIINSPNNPTGVVYDEKLITDIAYILNKKQKEYNHPIYLLSDEPYRELIYNNQKYPFITNYYNNALVVYSFSKSISIPGERIGYLLVGSKCENANHIFNNIKGAGRTLGYVCANTLFQHLIPYCQGFTSDLNKYKENQDILYEHLINLGYEVTKPDGAFYLFVKALEKDANKFSETAKKFELILVPSDSFGIEGYVRISYCVSKKVVLDSLSAFEKLYNHYKSH